MTQENDFEAKLLKRAGLKSLKELMETPIAITVLEIIGGQSKVIVLPTCIHDGFMIFFTCPVAFIRLGEAWEFKMYAIELEEDRWFAYINSKMGESRQTVLVEFLV